MKKQRDYILFSFNVLRISPIAIAINPFKMAKNGMSKLVLPPEENKLMKMKRALVMINILPNKYSAFCTKVAMSPTPGY
ncbi:hypothetical protein [Jeotgalibacillus sp. R-1-5s-1]|uniref:hypothetical protein n=1 Tax=Jeotgalibacillus sp. R-1-5s-1 TaxID=2555897 RepID=UPI00106A350F|nr:hypothetical protein [Jeotgalibacillus sp. R-1-5s-1]TFE00846.1 hypothetical protein E2491_04875 [Jeotgalibacillus sp. R-1-5s-1]